MLAAVLACGEGTAVSHRAAAELLDLWDRRPALIDVSGPTQAGRKIQGLRHHRVRLPPGDVTVQDGILCTTVTRTLVDMAGSCGEKSLRALVEQAAVLRALDVHAIHEALMRERRRGAPQLRRIIDPWRSEAERLPRLRSRLEARLLPAIVAAGLQRPRCNVKLKIDGELFEADLLWDDQRLIVETDGEETHGTPAAFHSDRRRDQILMAAGYRTARVTWEQIEEEREAVVDRIRRILGAASA